MIYRTFITKEEVQQLEIIRFEGPIEVVDSAPDLIDTLQELAHEPFVGFDTETKPSFVKGEYHDPALIQLSTMEKAYIIRIKKTGFTNSLKAFFENTKVKKIGISIRDDIKDLQKVREFVPGGFVDINHIAERMSITQIGVKSLVGIFLNKRVSKSQQTSNWENKDLTPAQQTYAATDAWVCFKIYEALTDRGYV